MSADNWTTCPNCQKLANEAQAKRRKKVDESYGKVSADEYLMLVEQSRASSLFELQTTLREDYEQGIEGDVYYVKYRAGCTECGWTFEFDHEETAFFGNKKTAHSMTGRK